MGNLGRREHGAAGDRFASPRAVARSLPCLLATAHEQLHVCSWPFTTDQRACNVGLWCKLTFMDEPWRHPLASQSSFNRPPRRPPPATSPGPKPRAAPRRARSAASPRRGQAGQQARLARRAPDRPAGGAAGKHDETAPLARAEGVDDAVGKPGGLRPLHDQGRDSAAPPRVPPSAFDMDEEIVGK
jgi:hypothetical protein